MVSSLGQEFIIDLYHGLLTLNEFDFGEGIKLNYQRTKLIQEKILSDREVIFKKISPILIEDIEEKPLLPVDENLIHFNRHFKEIHKRIFKNQIGREPWDELYLKPL